MRILALDTSTEYCSVALWQDGAIVERCDLAVQKHSEMLIAMLDALLKDAGFRIKDMDGIAFGMGPGSFTGVRIACGATQGLAFGASLPVAGVCTLQALAEASGKPRVIAALDARMGEIYHAAYEKHDGAWVTVSEPRLCKPEDAPPVPGNDWFGAGSGFAVYGEALSKRYIGQCRGTARRARTDDMAAVPQAAAIAALGAAQFAQGLGKDAAEALPLYLRDKVALKTNERVGARETFDKTTSHSTRPSKGDSQVAGYVRAPARRAVPVRMRAMTRGDVDAVLAIEQAVQRFPWTRGNFADALNSGYLCCVDETEEDGIRGYAILMPAADEAELLNIGVAAAQQRKGLGRAMLSEMLDAARAKQLRRVFLEVRPSNVAAIALYRSAGFGEIGVRHGYYQNANGSEDALVMARELMGEANG